MKTTIRREFKKVEKGELPKKPTLKDAINAMASRPDDSSKTAGMTLPPKM
jgi:hypothetical protein